MVIFSLPSTIISWNPHIIDILHYQLMQLFEQIFEIVQYRRLNRQMRPSSRNYDFHNQIRQKYLQQLFNNVRSKFMQSSTLSQIPDPSPDFDFNVSPQKVHKSWGYLFDQFKNFNSISTLAEIYNNINEGEYHELNEQIIEMMIRKIIDEIEYQSVLISSKSKQQILESQQAVIIMLILIYRGLDRELGQSRNRETMQNKIREILEMVNIKQSVKSNLGVKTYKEITYY